MRSLRLIPALVLFAFNAIANVVPARPGVPVSSEEARKQLAAFFAGGGVGDLTTSPGLYEAVQNRIATLPDEQLLNFQELMTAMPGWQTIPQAIAAAIPPDVMENLERADAGLTARIGEAERIRDDVRTLATVLRVLPDAKLAELGIDRQMLDSIDGSFAAISPEQAVMLHKQLAEIGTWSVKSASAMAALPPELRGGASALAKHGPLTDDDRRSLEQFRTDLVAVLGKVDKLPASLVPSLVPERLRQQIGRIAAVRPEVLFMIREQLPAEKLATLRENVAVLDRVAHLTDRERAALETFRADFVDAMTGPGSEARPDDLVRGMMAQLSPEHLLILQDKLAAVPEWKETLPPYYHAMSAPDFAARIAAVRGPAPDAARLSELHAFRAQALQYIQAAAGEEGVDAALLQRASKAVAGADSGRLELIRSLAAQMDGMSPAARLKVISHGLNCVIDIEIAEFDLGFICDPIEDAIAVIEDLVKDVKIVQSTLASVVTTVDSLVTDITNKVVEIIDTVDEISSFIETIPHLAWDAIAAALDQLLNINVGGLTLRDLMEAGIEQAVPILQAFFRLRGNWWDGPSMDVSLPIIPCPPEGTMTPFGEAGSTEADQNFKRYEFFIKTIFDIIPDTETSLKYKITAKRAYAPWGFLGVCLGNASETSGLALDADRHTDATTQVATTTSALSVQLTNTYDALLTHGNAQTNALNATINAARTALSSQLTASTERLSNELEASTTKLTNQIDKEATAQRALDLRLQIELNLQAGEGKALTMFQLPELQGGYLELVRETVNHAITSMLAAGQSINHAQRYFNDAQTSISQGRYKEAFKLLQTAYREVAK